MGDEVKSGLGGTLGTFLLFPAVASCVAGAITGHLGFFIAGAALAGVFVVAMVWLRPRRRVLEAALMISALWLVLGSLGITLFWLFGGAPPPLEGIP